MRLVCLAALLSVVAAVDQISNLPGVDWKLNFKHYSGFFQVSETHHLHYWFVESQNSPQTDPLIFWFNGGPGCSSLDGLLNEMGPYMAHKDGKTLVQNPNSWNKMASVVYIESPAGVGYSYSTDQNITTNDDQTSLENYEAVKKFFQTFPDFRDRSTYITGESYGGVYAPTLTARIIDGQKEFPINLKGMALGNGYVNAAMNVDTAVRFAHSHGLVDEKIWNTLEKECCKGCADSCDLSKVEGHCAGMVEDIFQFLWTGGLNPYDLYRDCDATPEQNGDRMTHILRGVAPRFEDIDYPEKNSSLLFRKDEKLYGAPCLNDSDVTSYMNDGDVRRALNIPINLGKWDICNDAVSDSYQKQYADMAPFIKKIINARVRVLLFYGDTDMACNFLMGQEFSANLGLKRRAGKTPWVVNHQIAGFKTLYEGLTFLTVRGAGHMAPQWKAPEMYHVIQQFLLNQPI